VNAQSANIETVFAKSIIPYRMLGGIRFYERKEIKDMLAYFCLVNNPADAVRLKRIINEPKRGIGDTTITAVEQIALEENKTMFEIISNADNYPALSRSVNKLKGFADLIYKLTQASREKSLPEFFEMVFEESGYRNMLEEAGQKSDKYDGRYKFGTREERFERSEEKDRLDNVKELISQAITYTQEKELENESADLTGFLEEVALISDIDKYDENADAVALMTIHSSKGLEFPVVFLSGMEENIFPSMQSSSEPDQLEEERRLAYVAVTRAKEKLYLTYAKERLIYGRSGYNKISRFAEEIPEHTAEFVRIPENERRSRVNMSGFGQKKYPLKVSPTSEFATAYTTASTPGKSGKSDAAKSDLIEFKKGDVVEHSNFGEGMIIKATDMKGDILYEVSFDSVGTKKIMGTYAKFKLKEE
jgi:DNA helicase-2/ATP-dependent DNA helicase PcrA